MSAWRTKRKPLTGAINLTKSATEKFTENLLVIDDAELAVKYTENWKLRLENLVWYVGNEVDFP